MRANKRILRAALVGLGAVLFAACNGPIVARSPEALYALAQDQIGNANYYPAVDTLARVAREAPKSELARRARVLRVTLLAGMARAFKNIAESYLAGHEQAGAAAYAGQMRAVAMDYFGRSRGRAIEMLEALDFLLREPVSTPVRLDLSLPAPPAGDSQALARVRQGSWVEQRELGQLEKVQLAGELTQAGSALAAGLPGAGAEIDPARFYLKMAQEIVELSSIYRPEALGDRRMLRLFHERAASAASRAAQLAQEKGDSKLQEESLQVVTHCQDALKKL